MLTAWKFSLRKPCVSGAGRTEPMVVAVDATARFYDAREHAYKAFHTTEIVWETADPKDAEAVLRWEGHDAGRIPTKRLVVDDG